MNTLIYTDIFLRFQQQTTGPYSGTNQFLYNFYFGLGGLGLWVIFFILAVASVAWLLYDSSNRRIRAVPWRVGVILTACLLLPAILFRFSVTQTDVNTYYDLKTQISNLQETQTPADWRDIVTQLQSQINDLPALVGGQEFMVYLGILGGLLPVAIAVGYYLTYRGLKGCVNGHVYDQQLSQCPECARIAAMNMPQQPVYQPPIQPVQKPQPIDVPVAKPKIAAWLVTKDGKSFQLNRGETTVGRSSSNDIQIIGDTTLSKQHAKIVEQNGHFKLFDLGSTNGTRVNNHRVQQVMLAPDDEVQFGDDTFLRFVTTQQ